MAAAGAEPWSLLNPSSMTSQRTRVLFVLPSLYGGGAERGLPCLAAWVWLMGALGWHILRVRRRLGRGPHARVADAAFAGWLAFVVEGCFEYNFGTSSVLMVFLFLVSTPFVAERFERPPKSHAAAVGEVGGLNNLWLP